MEHYIFYLKSDGTIVKDLYLSGTKNKLMVKNTAMLLSREYNEQILFKQLNY
jgi:hypothetical protein